MKRALLSLIAASALALSMAGIAAAEDYKFPCADITGGGGTLSPDETSGRYDFEFNLTTPTRCGGMVYTLYVFDTEAQCVAANTPGATFNPLATLVEKGADATSEGLGQVVFGADSLSADTSTWVFGKTAKGSATFDVAPDEGTGCVEVGVDPPSGSGFR